MYKEAQKRQNVNESGQSEFFVIKKFGHWRLWTCAFRGRTQTDRRDRNESESDLGGKIKVTAP